MVVTGLVEEVRRVRWSDSSSSWGLVPTMGYLHQGHLSLVRRAKTENNRVAVSIFVNPTQFAPTEDLSTYPRDPAGDLNLLTGEGVDLVFVPDNDQMYPPGFQTTVAVSDITARLEGASRPTHFRGVTTVVAKLFNIFQPNRAYFGQKDAQQAAVVKRMARDLDFNLEVVVCPIVRERDGLAMSSRNVRLSDAQRKAAVVLSQALQLAEERLSAGSRNADELRQLMADHINSQPLARLDYVSVAEPDTLVELTTVGDRALLSLAVYFGGVRLIDNTLVQL